MRYKGQNEEKTRWLIDITEWMTSHYVKIHSVIGKSDVMTAGTSTINRIILPIRSGIDPMEGLLNASFKGDPEFEGLEPQGRKVELLIQEKASGKHGFSLLAPVGAGIKEPRQLFLVYMPCIDLVRRTGSLFEGRIGDLILRPESLPILLNWRRVWFVRYAAKPVIGTLNPPMGKPLIIDMSVPGKAEMDGMMIAADEKGRATRINAGQEPGRVELDFLPGFPNLLEIPDGGSDVGRWTIHIAGVNITGGSYCASREGDRVAVELDVTQNWKHSEVPEAPGSFTSLRSRRLRGHTERDRREGTGHRCCCQKVLPDLPGHLFLFNLSQ